MQFIKKRREFLWAVAFFLITALLVHLTAAALRPFQQTYGSTWNAFLAEPEDSLDVIWLGSSYAYCDVNPAVVYDHSGLTGFVMAGGEQPLSITYWYLKEILKTQSPSAVILEGTGVFFQPYQNYTQQNITTMPVSVNRLGAVFTAAEPELRKDLFFDLSYYHGRWKEFTLSDLKRAIDPGQWDEYKGFTPMVGTPENLGDTPVIVDRIVAPEVYADNMAWMKKILTLCQKHNIQAVVVFHPSYTRCTAETYARIGEEIRTMDPNVLFFDWSAKFEEIGLVPAEHLYDGGHLNRNGAAVFSAWLGQILTQELSLTPRAQTAENQEAWQRAVEFWHAQ